MQTWVKHRVVSPTRRAFLGTASCDCETLLISYLLWAERGNDKEMKWPERREGWRGRRGGEARMSTMAVGTGKRKGSVRWQRPRWKWKAWGGAVYFREAGRGKWKGPQREKKKTIQEVYWRQPCSLSELPGMPTCLSGGPVEKRREDPCAQLRPFIGLPMGFPSRSRESTQNSFVFPKQS